MASRVANICVDAHDPIAQAGWWEQVLDDFHVVPEGEWNDDEAELRGPGGRWLEFLRVPEAKTVKNRMHLCLRPVDTTGDPEGNEFCVLATGAEEAGIDPA